MVGVIIKKHMNMRTILLTAMIILASTVFAFAVSTLEKASPEQIAKIKMVLPEDLTIEDSIVVKSSNHKNAYYIGVKFIGKGYTSSVVGLWLIGGEKNNPSLLYSINDKAFIYSQMRKASETKATAYETDPESKLILEKLK